MTPLAARAVMAAALVPFLVFAARDQLLHLRVRKVPLLENVIHFALAVLLMVVIRRAFQFDTRGVIFGAIVFVFTGALDEFVYHRRIPESESDVHAKEHFALLGFIVVALGIAQVVRG